MLTLGDDHRDRGARRDDRVERLPERVARGHVGAERPRRRFGGRRAPFERLGVDPAEQLAVVDDADPPEPAGVDRPAGLVGDGRVGATTGPSSTSMSPTLMRASRFRPRSAPTNSRTKSFAGSRSTVSGGANCSSTPPMFRIAMRSLSLIASSTSWVTNTIVLRKPGLDVEELVLQAAAHDRVDRGERLVHQHHGRVGGQRPGDADPLTLPAEQLGRVAIEELAVEVEDLEQLVDPARRCERRPSRPGVGTVAMFWRIVRCGSRPVCWIT